MTEGTAAREAGRWRRFWSGTAAPWLAEPYVGTYILPAALFILTFLVYWWLGPQKTLFDNHVNQANSLLHGHLDLVPEYSGFITEPALKDGKMYLQHGLGPALMLLPAVAIFGRDTNQTLVSVLLASACAPLVYWIVRTQVKDVVTQIGLVILFMFGTIFWFVGANGGVWFLSHTATTFFMLIAVYATLGPRQPWLAAAAVGAAFLCRSTVALSFPFFLIMFSDLWLKPDEGQGLLRRIEPMPLFEMASAASPFILFAFAVNYARFDNPLEGGYSYGEQVHQEELAWLYNHGIFNISYIQRHIPAIFSEVRVLQTDAPYVLPTQTGMAIWATTPAFFLALFARLKDPRLAAAGATALGLAVVFIIGREVSDLWNLGLEDVDFPLGLNLLPFWAMIGIAIYAGVRARDKLILASWAAIVPIAFTLFLFAATGWSQFGYRYALDFYPFLFLLVVRAVGERLSWYAVALIVASVLVNLWGVVWWYQFEPAHFLDLDWITFQPIQF